MGRTWQVNCRCMWHVEVSNQPAQVGNHVGCLANEQENKVKITQGVNAR